MSCVPPKVTTLSETEIICVGDTITMAIYATGSNLQYFWQKFQDNFYVDLQADNRYVGLGTPVLQIVNPEKEQDDGLYRCLVKNSCDSDTSEIFVIKTQYCSESRFADFQFGGHGIYLCQSIPEHRPDY